MCGVIGFFGIEQPVKTAVDLMTALQHRGEQSAGAAFALKNNEFVYERALGLSPDLFGRLRRNLFVHDDVRAGICHLRYGTSGARQSLSNAQPLYGRAPWGEFYLGHNGDSPNFEEMRSDLIAQGAVFSTDADSELLVKYIELLSQGRDSLQAFRDGLRVYKGTYAITALIKDKGGLKLIAARDSSGNRPLVIGKLGDGFVVASEDSAFELVKATRLMEVGPGTMVVISGETRDHPRVIQIAKQKNIYHCVFEGIYFSYPTSHMFGISLARFRETLGARLAKCFGVHVKENDVVTNVPDSSNYIATGFCREQRTPLQIVFVRRHYRVGGFPESVRSFIQGSDGDRDETIRNKFSIDVGAFYGRRVWIIDDSIVRGKTSRSLVSSLRQNGAIWVGVLSGSPPIIGPSQKGIDLSDLIASNVSCSKEVDVEAVRESIGADFLGYLPLKELKAAVDECGADHRNYCFGCFEGREPIWGKW